MRQTGGITIMGFGPAIEGTYRDGMTLTLTSIGSMAELAPLFPVPEELRQFSIGRWQGYMEQSSPSAYYDEVLAAGGITNWAICTGEQHTVVGTAGISEERWFYTNILDPEQQGKQIGTRTSRLIIAASFLRAPGLHEIVTFAHKKNAGALRMIKKLGMQEDVEYGQDPTRQQQRFTIERPKSLADASLSVMLHALGERGSARAVILG